MRITSYPQWCRGSMAVVPKDPCLNQCVFFPAVCLLCPPSLDSCLYFAAGSLAFPSVIWFWCHPIPVLVIVPTSKKLTDTTLHLDIRLKLLAFFFWIIVISWWFLYFPSAQNALLQYILMTSSRISPGIYSALTCNVIKETFLILYEIAPHPHIPYKSPFFLFCFSL